MGFKICKECGHKLLRISWSGLRTHHECKQRGYLTRTGHKSKLENTRNFFPGNVTDRVVRDWLNNNAEDNLGMMPSMVETIMEREKDLIESEGGVMLWKDRADKAQVTRDCIEAVTKIEPALIEKVLPFDYQPDYRFDTPVTIPHPDGGMELIMLIGFMDIIVRRDDGRFAVYDVKHTRDGSYWRKTQAQLGFYDLEIMIEQGAETYEVGLLQPLVENRPVRMVPLDRDSRSQMMSSITAMAHDIWHDDKAPRVDNKLCGYCPVQHACSKFAPVSVSESGQRRFAF